MSGYAAYPTYRDSGVEWLGDVPQRWIVLNIKHAIDAIGDVDHYMPKSVEEGIPYIMTGDLEELVSDINFAECKQVNKNDFTKLSQKIKSEKGDVIVARYATIGTTAYVDIEKEFLVSYSCVTIKPCDEKIFGLYLFYFFKTYEFSQGIKNQVNTNTQGNVGIQDLKNFEIPLPNLQEQQKIANFLDHETAKIDTLIEKQQQLIKLLKEKRQAVISHAVTKGLNPDAPMKDSGVEWLGEVPEGWDIRAISKLSTKITNGYVGPTRDILVDEGVSYVQATHIKKGKVNFDDAYFVRKNWSDSHAKSILVKGDVLIVQTGAGTGDIGLVTEAEEGFNCHALIIVAPMADVVFGEYLSLILQSHYGYSVLYSIRTGGMHPHLNCGEVQFVKLPVPSVIEQQEICDHIKKNLANFDELISKQVKAIVLMKERRIAIISAAVTGKIDVRNWQPPASGAEPASSMEVS